MALAPVETKLQTPPAALPAATAEARPAAQQTTEPKVAAGAAPRRPDASVQDTVERVIPITDAAGRLIGARFRGGPQPPTPGQQAGGKPATVTGANTTQSNLAATTVPPATAGVAGAGAAVGANSGTNAALAGINATGVSEYLATPMAPNADQMRAAGLTSGELLVPNNRRDAIAVLATRNREQIRRMIADIPELEGVLKDSYRRTHGGSLDGYERFTDSFADAMAAMTVNHNRVPEHGEGNVRVVFENGAATSAGMRELAADLMRNGASAADVRWMQGVFATIGDKSKPMAERMAALATISRHAEALAVTTDVANGDLPANFASEGQYRQAWHARMQRIEDGYRRAGIAITPVPRAARDASTPSFHDYRRIRDGAIVATIQGRANVSFRDTNGRLYAPTHEQLRSFPITTASARERLAAYDRALGNTSNDIARENGTVTLNGGTDTARATRREQSRIEQERAQALHAGYVRAATDAVIESDQKEFVAERQVTTNLTTSALNLGPAELTPGVAENRFRRA